MDGIDIDAVDYAILKCMDRHGGCWKKRVHQWISENVDSLPLTESKSVQTIGRRMDALHENELLESCILSPEHVNRDMIIGYKLTADGKQILNGKRNTFLRKMVKQASLELLTADNDAMAAVEREPLIRLMVDAFDIDEETRDELLPQLETEEILGLLATHFFLDNAGTTFTAENRDVMVAFLRRTPQFRRPFEDKNVITYLRESLADHDTEQATEHTVTGHETEIR